MKHLIIDGIRVEYDYTYESIGFKLKVLLLCATNESEIIKLILQRDRTLLKFLNLHHIKSMVMINNKTWEIIFDTKNDFKPKGSYV